MSKEIDSLLKRLSNIGPKSWSWITATTFSALNCPEEVSTTFLYALKELSTPAEKLSLAREFRESIFKTGILYGYPKAINALVQLHSVMPEELKEKSTLRETNTSVAELNRMGQDFFDQTYDTTAESVQTLLRDAYPDLEFFSIALAYGYVYSFSSVLNPYETSFAMIAALIPLDVPRQIDWHLKGALRNGADVQTVKAVREIVVAVAESCGAVWKNEIPDVVDMPVLTDN